MIPLPRLLPFFVVLLAACVPVVHPAGPATETPRLTRNFFDQAFLVARDGKHLPMRLWRPAGDEQVRAVIVALHGMNDYSNAFALPGPVWAERGIATYAIDQRGHGGNVPRGLWPGIPALIGDLDALVNFVRRRHPGVPVYALGVSMGGAVVMASQAAAEPAEIDGAILVAPAVWGPQTMPRAMRAGLWLAAHTMRSAVLTGRALERTPTDNIALLRKMAADPRVQKGARVDMIYGVVQLMGVAHAAAADIDVPVLLLYGERDEIIPRGPTLRVVERLPDQVRVAVYENGYHMLLRDKQRAVVHSDIAHWVLERGSALPSGADTRDAAAVLGRKLPAGTE